ncbi:MULTISPECIES: CPBP family intramembrane glutamic endopeptidase [Bacillus]|jgi:membrane protease YdiL (CAAX protease family)|uniref:CPBP family intramembrane glutamic endopeptidase n=1 Tax=Bacillus luti TaxID=2026191 RepID=A0ABU8I045_9BACI|nr:MULTISPECIES: CPBP family intramembrane glutamic endopeptidase [Bacillus]EEL84767.1 Caax amino protease [Bacillus cereus AH1272]EEL90380.1 Caax amino protease [Bacillus cereus AH1273]MCM0006739.1 CPBP family intramembrane metalloprotease [Bacillus paranthracis]MDV8115677.1 CPBP family intramembrane glutamic endopeptidase [Bacillus sp. BAU-SS-2023]CJB83982.1 CAAX amino terminal protease family membrane protein [Streptococcus pneumoniae]HDX9701284.1 CPBP family intramembrane metalloprotease 
MKGEYSKMNHSNLHKSGYVILIYFVMTQFVGIIGVQLLAKTGWYDIKGNQQQAIQQLLIHWELIGFSLILTFTFLVYKKEAMNDSKLSIKLSRNSFVWILIGIVAVFLAQTIGSILDKSIFHLTTQSVNTSSNIEAATIAPLALISIVILAPLVEELVFRYAAINILSRKFNEIGCILISSVFFSIMHFDFPFVFGYFLIGLVLAAIYVRTNRLLVSFIIHATMNLIIVILQIF